MTSDRDKQKHTLFLFRGDFEKLQDAYPKTGASKIIRLLVRQAIEKIENSKTPIKNLKVEADL